MGKGMFDDVEGIVKKQLVLFFVIDTSRSMEGTKIGTVNNAIRELVSGDELEKAVGSDADLKIACLTFSSGCKWLYDKPIAAESFKWQNVDAYGVTDLGAACRELKEKMSREKFLAAPSASCAPIIFLMSDGEPTDDFESGLGYLQENSWFKHAIKVSLAIGDDAKIETLAKFTGSKEAVVSVYTPEEIAKWIKLLSVTTAEIGSDSQGQKDGKPEEKQNKVIEKIQNIQQSDPDLSSTSTNGNDFE